jgi:hypothetical protein
MAGNGAGKGSRPRKIDLKKYGKHFEAIFSKSRNNAEKASVYRTNSHLANNF